MAVSSSSVSPKRSNRENPILTKELRTRMRGARAFWILFVYLGLLSLILFFTYLAWWNSTRGDFSERNMSFYVGKTFFGVIFTVQALLVGLITPALTSGGVSIEKEQRTYELLSVSLLPRRSIVMGKLTAAVSFVLLLLTSSLPLVSLGFLLGGISPLEVATAYGLLALCAVLYGAVGIACSSLAKNTSTATVMAYGTILLLFFTSLPLTFLSLPGFFGAPGAAGSGAGRGVGLTALNPIGAVTAGTTKEMFFGISSPAWLTALVVNGLLAVIFIVVAIHRLEYPRSDRSGLLRVLTAVWVAIVAFCLYGIFAPASSFGSNLTFVSSLTICAPILLVPLFATGDDLPPGRLRFALFDPRRLRLGEAPSGLVYALLLVGLCGLILKAGLAYSSAHAVVAPGVQTNPFGVTAGTPVTGSTAEILPLFVLTLAATWFFGTLGLLFSLVLKNRWSAFSLTAAAMILFYTIPPTITAGREAIAGHAAQGSLWDNFLYFSPLVAVVELAGHKAVWDGLNGRSMLFGETRFAEVTPLLYAVLGVVVLLVTSRLQVKQRTVQAQKKATAAALGV